MKRRFIAFLVSAAAATVGMLAVPATSQVAPPAVPAAPAGPQTRTLDSVIALVNGELISAWDVRNRMTMMMMAMGSQQQPSRELLAQMQREAIESIIDEKIKLQEFTQLSKGNGIADDEIDEEIAGLARQNRMTSDAFVKNFESSGASIQTLRDQIKSQIAWRALIGGRYGKTVRVSELRIDEMMNRVKESMDSRPRPPRRRAATSA
jgi:peptidyl-prolyl cis-trans isomerase SurA